MLIIDGNCYVTYRYGNITTYLREFVLVNVNLQLGLDDLNKGGWQRVLLLQLADGGHPAGYEAVFTRDRIAVAKFFPVQSLKVFREVLVTQTSGHVDDLLEYACAGLESNAVIFEVPSLLVASDHQIEPVHDVLIRYACHMYKVSTGLWDFEFDVRNIACENGLKLGPQRFHEFGYLVHLTN